MIEWFRCRTYILNRSRLGRRGVAVVEFGFIAPIMVISLVAVYDLGNALQQNIRLNQAVRAGGLYAMEYGGSQVNGNSPEFQIRSIVQTAASPLSLSTNTAQCFCATTTVSCLTTCSPVTAPRTVRITATAALNAIFLINLQSTTAQYVERIK